jgi:hypothetical protein
MSGMLPSRKSKEEVERANLELIKQHQQYVNTWVKDRQPKNDVKVTVATERMSPKPQ